MPPVLTERKLGRNGPEVGAIGLGVAPMSGLYGEAAEDEGLRAIDVALDLGMNLLDTADVYGSGHNERLLGTAIRGRRDEAIVATKFGNVLDPAGRPLRISGRADYVHEACEQSLRRLGVDVIDLYLQHRVDPDTPIEETVGAMAELVQAGKVRYIGLCEALPADLRRAAAVHPIAVLQSEYSVLEEGRRRRCSIPARSSASASWPTRRSVAGCSGANWTRRGNRIPATREQTEPGTRGSGPRSAANLKLAQTVRRIAADHDAGPAEVALAWLLARRPWIVPIPGTRRESHLRSNARADALVLSEDETAALEDLAGNVSGARFGTALPTPEWVSPTTRSS